MNIFQDSNKNQIIISKIKSLKNSNYRLIFMPAENLKKVLIETSVDKLVVLARQKRGITVPEAAKLLGASERQIEDWTRVLEEHNLLKLVFPMMGPPKIVPVAVSQAKFSKKLEEFKERKSEIENLAEEYLGKSKDSEKLLNLKFVPVEEGLYEKLKELEGGIKTLNVLKGAENKMESDISEFEKEKDLILRESGELEKRTSEITKKIDSVTASSQDMAADVADAMAEMQKEGRNARILEGQQKKIEDEITALEKEMKIVSALTERPKKNSLVGRLSGLFGHKKEKRKPYIKKKDGLKQPVPRNAAQPPEKPKIAISEKPKILIGKKPRQAVKKANAKSAAKIRASHAAKRKTKKAKKPAKKRKKECKTFSRG